MHTHTHTITIKITVLEAPPSMRHWWENTEMRSLAVHFPPSPSSTRPRDALSDLELAGVCSDSDVDDDDDTEEEGGQG